jgi:nucleoside-diphosphate-sugar epimerase
VKVVLSGGTGVIGSAAVPALVNAGHRVVALSRNPENVKVLSELGALPLPGDLFDVDSLTDLYKGADAVINLATHVPVGYAGALPGSWREHDRLRTTGVANVVEAARRAGVRRVVQESVSFVYADHGDDWITEQDPIEITPSTEPSCVGESHVQDYACDSRVGVVLRFGSILGDDPLTRFWLRAASHGRPVGIGRPESWAHLVHTDDLGSAVVAALHAPSGVYNVGSEPVLRKDLVAGFAEAAGAGGQGSFMGPMMRRLSGQRIEPLTRSLRISSDHFEAQTGWRPSRPEFDSEWFDVTVAVDHAVH